MQEAALYQRADDSILADVLGRGRSYCVSFPAVHLIRAILV